MVFLKQLLTIKVGLLNPKNKLHFKDKQKNAVPVPDYVVNFETKGGLLSLKRN